VKRFCVYHSRDLDGRCSAAIVRFKHLDVELIGYDYGEPLDLEQFRGAQVFMVDISLQPFGRMLELHDLCELHWIDHHKTAIAESEDRRVKLKGKREVGKAGCELTWAYLFPNNDIPPAVEYLGRYDVWDCKLKVFWEDTILPFQYGMRSVPNDPGEEIWREILVDGLELDDLIETGTAILSYERQRHAEACRADAFAITFDGLRVLCLNHRSCGSQWFESKWNHDDFDAMLAFGYGSKKWTVSLYTDKPGVDVGEVARKRGGGGHKGAAGFQLAKLPQELGG
jgi:hypothetical protein